MTIEEKAERLLLTGAVTVELAVHARVKGDHDSYRLYRDLDRWRCPCRARKKCSHILAVERVTG